MRKTEATDLEPAVARWQAEGSGGSQWNKGEGQMCPGFRLL